MISFYRQERLPVNVGAEIAELEVRLKDADGTERARLKNEATLRRSRCEAIAREVEGKEE